MSFITVETYNTCLHKRHDVNILHTIDTSLIGTYEFEDVVYDFTIIEHTISGSNHTFNFEIINVNWKGKYYILDSDGEFLDVTATYDSTTKTLSVTTTEDSIQLVLYCTQIIANSHFELLRLEWIPENLEAVPCGPHIKHIKLYYVELNGTITGFEGYGERFNQGISEPVTITMGSDSQGKYVEFDINFYDKVSVSGIVNQNQVKGTYYIGVVNIKETPDLRFPSPVIAGKMNKVYFENDSVFNGLISGTVTYNGNSFNIQSDSTGYYFQLDLTSKQDDNPVRVTVDFRENDKVDGSQVNYTLPCNYPTVISEAEFLTELMQGTSIIELGDDIDLSNRVTINHPVLIYGNNHNIVCNDYGFIVNNDVQIHETIFYDGQTVFVQEKNTNLRLYNCRFNNAFVNLNNYHASVLDCNIDIDSLNNPRDYTTTFKDCFFYNCENTAIRHGGLITIDTCKSFTDFMRDNIQVNYPYFIYQIDGDALIQNSVFDIDCEEYPMCSQDMDFKFAPALFMVGETASVNNNDYTELQSLETINFFNQPYNNRSHILIDYLFDEIDACIYLSPTLGMEDKALCYSLSGEDYLYKQNVQVTRKSWGTENRNKKIIWDDI